MEANYFAILWWFLPYVDMNQPRVYTCPPILSPPSQLSLLSSPLGCPRAPALSVLLHASNLHWSSVLHMVIYMFECYSLTSHPCLLPYSPKVCSLYLCILMSCIKCHCYHLSKFHVYALIYCVGVSLSDFTLYNRLQFHPPH